MNFFLLVGISSFDQQCSTYKRKKKSLKFEQFNIYVCPYCNEFCILTNQRLIINECISWFHIIRNSFSTNWLLMKVNGQIFRLGNLCRLQNANETERQSVCCKCNALLLYILSCHTILNISSGIQLDDARQCWEYFIR